MSNNLDSIEHERTLESQLAQNEKLLTAILTGIALMNDLTAKELIELSEGS